MDDIEIPKEKDSSITEPIKLKLGEYTIFAGDNNAGKTNLIRAIKKNLEKKDIHVIYIPAERVVAEKEIDTGNQKDPMRQAISDLIEVSFDLDSSIKSSIDDIAEILPKEFNKYGVEKISISIKTNKPKIDDYTKQIKDIYAKNLIDSVTIKDGYSAKNGISISKVGQGTQRLIVASLIEYLSNKKKSENKTKTYIIFEEPEVYLHPKLKESLYKSLLELSKNIGIIVSTHDPYFIQLGLDKIIYKVSREGPNGSTKIDGPVEKKYLYYDSYAEINYQIFGLASDTYFLELYEHVKDLCEERNGGENIKYHYLDDLMFNIYFEKNGLRKNCTDDTKESRPIMPITRLRHDLAHGKKSSIVFDKKELIRLLIKFIEDKAYEKISLGSPIS